MAELQRIVRSLPLPKENSLKNGDSWVALEVLGDDLAQRAEQAMRQRGLERGAPHGHELVAVWLDGPDLRPESFLVPCGDRCEAVISDFLFAFPYHAVRFRVVNGRSERVDEGSAHAANPPRELSPGAHVM